jgi:hypothetical protein
MCRSGVVCRIVRSAYELSLLYGTGSGFAPDESVTIAETLALACR